MNDTLTTLLPLGLAIALSPEIIALGLLVASRRERARSNALAFFIAGTVGIAICLAIGFFIGTAEPSGPSWNRFFLRVLFGALLIFLGIYVIAKKKGSALMNRMHLIKDVSVRTAAVLGFIVTGFNFKVISIVTAAGHQISEFSGSLADKLDELFLFAGLCMLPLILPLIIETVRPGLVSMIMAPCSRFLDKYGRFLTAAICFFFGFVFLKKAIAVMP